jgi:hypothetical protein
VGVAEPLSLYWDDWEAASSCRNASSSRSNLRKYAKHGQEQKNVSLRESRGVVVGSLSPEYFDVISPSVPNAGGKDEHEEGETPIRTIIEDENGRQFCQYMVRELPVTCVYGESVSIAHNKLNMNVEIKVIPHHEIRLSMRGSDSAQHSPDRPVFIREEVGKGRRSQT